MSSLEQKCADLKPVDLTDKPLFFDDVIGLQDQKDDLIKSLLNLYNILIFILNLVKDFILWFQEQVKLI